MTTPQKYLIPALAAILVAGCKSSDRETYISAASNNVPAGCPIRSVANGMTVRQVRAKLLPWHMQYRGERQDQLAYHVDGGTSGCQAFIDFNSETRRVDAVEYGEGNFTLPYEKRDVKVAPDVALESPQISAIKDPVIPDFKNGEIVTQGDYVSAFVSENEGVNRLSDSQLMYLGKESWDALRSMDSGLNLFGSNPEGKFFEDWRRLSEASHGNPQPQPEAYFPDITKRIYSVGDPGIEPPALLRSVKAAYTVAGYSNKISGKSLVEFVIDSKGYPQQIRTAIPLGYGLDESAIAAVRKFRFRPATHYGVPVSVAITYGVAFDYGG